MRAFPHVMRPSFPRPAALLLLAVLAGGGRALAQQAEPVPVPRPTPEDAEALPIPPTSPEETEPAAVENAAVVGGSWSGWAKLTNDWPGLACQYEPAGDEPTVHLELAAAEPGLRGSVAIDIPAAPGSACPPLRKRYAIAEVRMAPSNASFTDSGGNEWTLGARRGGAVLQGTISWQQGGPDEPLAEGFTLPNGVRPLSRLIGEVRLRHDDPAGAAAAGETGTEAASAQTAAGKPAEKKGGAGTHVGNAAKVIGANVVGLACCGRRTSWGRAAARPESSRARRASASSARRTRRASARATSSPARRAARPRVACRSAARATAPPSPARPASRATATCARTASAAARTETRPRRVTPRRVCLAHPRPFGRARRYGIVAR